MNSLRKLICLPWLTASYTDSGALTQGGVPLPETEDKDGLCRCHRMLFLLPVGTGTQGTEKKAATLGSAIDVRNKLSPVSRSPAFCQHPRNQGRLAC